MCVLFIPTAEASASASGSEEAKKGATIINTSATTMTTTRVFGGNPPSSDGADGFSEWAASVAESPMPVRIRLESIFLLLDAIDAKKTWTEEDFKAGIQVNK